MMQPLMYCTVSETPSSPSPPIGPVPTGHLRQEKCEYCPLVFTHEHHLKLCPSYPVECPNECGARGLTCSKITAHMEVCLLQCVECEYKQFGCAIVLLRKDMAEHLKTSVESHLQMTKKRVEEQEVRLQKELDEREVQLNDVKKLESELQDEKSKHQQMETRLLKVEDTLKNLMARLN